VFLTCLFSSVFINKKVDEKLHMLTHAAKKTQLLCCLNGMTKEEISV